MSSASSRTLLRLAVFAAVFVLLLLVPLCLAAGGDKESSVRQKHPGAADAVEDRPSDAAAVTIEAADEPTAEEPTEQKSHVSLPVKAKKARIAPLLAAAEYHRFGVPLPDSALRAIADSSTSTGNTSTALIPSVRPAPYAFRAQASLAHSIAADKLVDIPRALELYEQAAALGSHEALNAMGEIALYGEGGTEPDYKKAFDYFARAATHGNADAQHQMAVLFSIGLAPALSSSASGSAPLTVGAPDDAAAVLYDYFAAQAGQPLAQMSLGYRHLMGIGVPKSCETAVGYYSAVAERVVQSSLSSPLAIMIEKSRLSDPAARQPAPEEDADVAAYYRASAENGDVAAQLALGQLHLFGARGFEQNPTLAARYFRAAANAGDVNAVAALGQLHLQGVGVSQNNETALKHLTEAANKNSAAALNSLGYMHLHGYGMPRDYKKALQYFKRSAEQGYPEAQFNLGAMYFAGLGVDKKYATALQYFTLAAHASHTRAMFNLAQMHQYGLGTVQSCAVAVRLHKTVAERGAWATVLSEAHRNYLKGRSETAWLQYARAAEEGHELAQANSAWLLDRGEGLSESAVAAVAQAREELLQKQLMVRGSTALVATENPAAAQTAQQPYSFQTLRYRLAHRHWTLASQQGHVDALRVLGDYAFDGVVTGKPDYKQALHLYQQAAEQRNAQAMFNLGYMHELGLGLSSPDFHLAKRWYDSCLEADPEAWVPVKLALFKLYVHTWWRDFWQPPAHDTAAKPASEPAATSSSTSAASSSASSSSDPSSDWLSRVRAHAHVESLLSWWRHVSSQHSWVDFFLSIEDILLALLCLALAVIVYYRSQRAH